MLFLCLILTQIFFFCWKNKFLIVLQCMLHSLRIDLCEEIMHVCIKSSLYIFIPRPLSNPSATFKRPLNDLCSPLRVPSSACFPTAHGPTTYSNITRSVLRRTTTFASALSAPPPLSHRGRWGNTLKFALRQDSRGSPPFMAILAGPLRLNHSHHSNHINKSCPSLLISSK